MKFQKFQKISVKKYLHAYIFNRGESRLDKKQIIKMLEYCGMSYSDCQAEGSDGKLIFVNDKKTGIQCFLRVNSSILTIVFRGSDSKKDWQADFKFWEALIPYNHFSHKIKVHTGFISTYKSHSVRGKIREFVNENIKKIYVTGHSYGAALAILCAIDLRCNFPHKDYEVVVFGCPRVGNKAFKNFYNLRLFKTLRVEHRRDIVPKVPFAFLGYRHVGAKIKIGKGELFKPYSMKKHNLQEYYSNIWDI